MHPLDHHAPRTTMLGHHFHYLLHLQPTRLPYHAAPPLPLRFLRPSNAHGAPPPPRSCLCLHGLQPRRLHVFLVHIIPLHIPLHTQLLLLVVLLWQLLLLLTSGPWRYPQLILRPVPRRRPVPQLSHV